MLDTARVFDRLITQLGPQSRPLLAPDLPLRLGMTPIAESAALLAAAIEARFGADRPVDVVGYSMGGVIARTWIQLMGGFRRTRRFISIGSPHQGTLTAHPWPGRLMAGIADLKQGSALLQQLNGDLSSLAAIDCCSFYSGLDLVVVPGWRAVLPVGEQRVLPVWAHPQLLRDGRSLQPLAAELLRP